MIHFVKSSTVIWSQPCSFAWTQFLSRCQLEPRSSFGRMWSSVFVILMIVSMSTSPVRSSSNTAKMKRSFSSRRPCVRMHSAQMNSSTLMKPVFFASNAAYSRSDSSSGMPGNTVRISLWNAGLASFFFEPAQRSYPARNILMSSFDSRFSAALYLMIFVLAPPMVCQPPRRARGRVVGNGAEVFSATPRRGRRCRRL
jgi:hypothetical protein